jgi:PAS domain S-box-containing protein
MKKTGKEKGRPAKGLAQSQKKLIKTKSPETTKKHPEKMILSSDTPFYILAMRMGQIIYNLHIKTGKIQRWGAIKEITGYNPGDLPEEVTFWEERMHSEDRVRVRRLFNKAKKEGYRFICQYRLRTKDGTYKYVEDNAIPLRDEKGRITDLFGAIRDITKEKSLEEELLKYRDRVIDGTEHEQTEKMLQENERQYRALMEYAPFPVLISSLEDGSFLYVNQQASELLKVPIKNDIVKLSNLRYSNPRDYDLLVKRLREDGFVKDYEVSLRGSRDQLFWMLISASVIRFNNKEAVFVTFNDVTERKTAAEALKRREEQFRTLVEKSSEVIFLSDENRNRVYVSPTIQNVLGYTVDEFLSVSPAEFTHPDHRTTVIANREWTFSHPGETITFVSRVRHKDGSWRWVETSLRNLIADPNIHAIVTNFHDITDRKEAEKQLEMKSLSLEEVNTALKVLLEQRERDRNELENKVVANVKELVLPYIDILKQRHLDTQQRAYLDVLETNLKNIISPFMQNMTSFYADFTPTEVKVANLIRDGKTVKEIANIFGLSETSVNTHRQHVRNKLGLKNKKNNLRTFLMSLK